MNKFKQVLAGILTAALCITSIPANGLGSVSAATAAERPDKSIVYFVDCGDYVVNTVSDGDQFGTHNSVTDQAYGEDPATGYQWGIVDTVSDPLKNGSASCGGVFTDNTWPFENNGANNDTAKISSNRYTKNQFENGIEERYIDYKFEIENGKYDVTVCCVDPWGCSKTPNVYLNYGKETQAVLKEGLNASASEAVTKTYEVTDGELTVNFRATGSSNLAINVAYILIKEYKELTPEEEEARKQKVVTNDCAALMIEDTDITSDLSLASQGVNGSTITWNSSDESLISKTGKVTRPRAGQADATVTLTATVSYEDITRTKRFVLKVLAESDVQELQEFLLSDIQIEDDYYNTVAEKDVEFLNKFDPDRLLYNFRLTAGYTAAEIKNGQFDFNHDNVFANGPYPGGWENSRIGGHTLGHYLAACAQAVENGYGYDAGPDGYTLIQRLEYLIDELKRCQDKLGSGFIFGATMRDANDPERQFNLLEQGTTSDTWVPWYTMHKIVNGLVETYKYTGNTTALEVAESLGEWIYNRVSKWDETIQRRVLGVEYGGMNDCLYELYKYAESAGYANADHFSFAAHRFDEDNLFARVLAGEQNVLNGLHANCTIPKFNGALNRYRTLGDETYLRYTEAFWTLITEKHTYITGGNSECEFFGVDNILDAERSHCNCETCNTHNMLKMTKELYRITGDKRYADFYETTFINAIMASVNEDTGMTTYFQPMATGFFKVYCNPDLEKNYFWCCTGTGLENFTKLGDGFYFYTGNKLIVNQYTSSTITWWDWNVSVKQETDIPNTDKAKFTINTLNGAKSVAMDLRLRVPGWTAGNPTVTVNGAVQNATISNGYISLERNWNNGDVVELTLPMEIRAYTLPDNAGNVYGFKYGPVVLAAELGTDNKMDTYQIGVQCDVCKTKIVNGQERTSTNGYGNTSNQGTLTTETLNIQDGVSVSEFIENIEDYLVKDANSLNFSLKGTDWGGPQPMNFVPYYRLRDQRYGIYWLFAGDDPAQAQERLLASKKTGRDLNVNLSGIGVGYGAQTEGDAQNYPHMEEAGNGSEGDMGKLTRFAKAGGSFSYLFKVDKTKTNYINCQYTDEDKGKTMVITCGDRVIDTDTLADTGSGVTYKKQYEIPKEIVASAVPYELKDETTGKVEIRDVLRISFSGADGEDSPKLHTSVYTSTNYSNQAFIAKMSSDIGTIQNNGASGYLLTVPSNTTQVQLITDLADKYGLLYINGILTDDTKAVKYILDAKETKIDMQVFAEDHVTKKDYVLTIVKNDIPAVESIRVSPAEKTLDIGQTVVLNVTVSPEAAEKGVTFRSQDNSIASVDSSGKVTAKKAGTTVITVTSNQNPDVKATCRITVKKPAAPSVALKKITLRKKTKSMSVGETYQLGVTFSPSNASNRKVKYNSSKKSIASVSSTGKVKAKKKGTTTITVTSLANSKIKATCKITVKKPTLKISGKSKVKKGKSIQLKATLKNLKGTVKWSVSNSKLAKITKTGKKVKLKAKKTGTVKVTAKVGSVKATKKIKIVK